MLHVVTNISNVNPSILIILSNGSFTARLGLGYGPRSSFPVCETNSGAETTELMPKMQVAH
jgi:hypothetical protein